MSAHPHLRALYRTLYKAQLQPFRSLPKPTLYPPITPLFGARASRPQRAVRREDSKPCSRCALIAGGTPALLLCAPSVNSLVSVVASSNNHRSTSDCSLLTAHCFPTSAIPCYN